MRFIFESEVLIYVINGVAQVMGDVFARNGVSNADFMLSLKSVALNATAVIHHSFDLPSYPHRDVCLDYESKCGEFIVLSGLAALIPDCSANVSSSPNNKGISGR
jgi:hypothetical protein